VIARSSPLRVSRCRNSHRATLLALRSQWRTQSSRGYPRVTLASREGNRPSAHRARSCPVTSRAEALVERETREWERVVFEAKRVHARARATVLWLCAVRPVLHECIPIRECLPSTTTCCAAKTRARPLLVSRWINRITHAVSRDGPRAKINHRP